MSSPTVLQGQGTSMTFPNGFTLSLLEVSRDGVEVDDVDVTDMAATPDAMGRVWSVFQPSKLANPGTLKIKGHYSPDGPAVPVGIPGTIVVTFPVPPSKVNGATWTSAGYIKSEGESVSMKEKITVELTVKFSGAPTYAASS